MQVWTEKGCLLKEYAEKKIFGSQISIQNSTAVCLDVKPEPNNSFNGESTIRVVRIKGMITNYRSSRLSKKFFTKGKCIVNSMENVNINIWV